jgi:hypothetical protein
MTVTPEQRFHSYVTAGTVTIMLGVIQWAVPLLEQFEGGFILVGTAIAFLVSAGVYKTLAALLKGRFRTWKWVKRWLLGPSYINGTWVGQFLGEGGLTVRTVEHFEQGLSVLKIRGYAAYEDGTWYADWESIAASIDEAAGKLTYIYDCKRSGQQTAFKGVCEFSFQRVNDASAPRRIGGYSADITDGLPVRNDESRYSEDLIEFETVLAALRPQTTAAPVSA